MNYIKQLQQQVAEQKQMNADCQELITAYMKYLTSSKFHGHENNFINATEAYNMLELIRKQLL